MMRKYTRILSRHMQGQYVKSAKKLGCMTIDRYPARIGRSARSCSHLPVCVEVMCSLLSAKDESDVAASRLKSIWKDSKSKSNHPTQRKDIGCMIHWRHPSLYAASSWLTPMAHDQCMQDNFLTNSCLCANGCRACIRTRTNTGK